MPFNLDFLTPCPPDWLSFLPVDAGHLPHNPPLWAFSGSAQTVPHSAPLLKRNRLHLPAADGPFAPAAHPPLDGLFVCRICAQWTVSQRIEHSRL